MKVIIAVTVNTGPDTLNLHSKAKWVGGYIELPAGYHLAHIE